MKTSTPLSRFLKRKDRAFGEFCNHASEYNEKKNQHSTLTSLLMEADKSIMIAREKMRQHNENDFFLKKLSIKKKKSRSAHRFKIVLHPDSYREYPRGFLSVVLASIELRFIFTDEGKQRCQAWIRFENPKDPNESISIYGLASNILTIFNWRKHSIAQNKQVYTSVSEFSPLFAQIKAPKNMNAQKMKELFCIKEVEEILEALK